MSEKIYLHFLILCGILCEGIIATLSDEDTKESSNFLIRKRRVINNNPEGLAATNIEGANYVVNVQKNMGSNCAGAILSHYTVITAALCVGLDISHYRVLSGARYESRGQTHNVTSKQVHYGNYPHHPLDGIALITVDPPFEYSRRIGYINLYAGILAAGTRVTVSGWGCSYPIQPARATRRALRSITLPIMDHRECQNIYRPQFAITEKHICTYDEQQYCAHTDEGAPLVVNNRLAGIHVWKGDRVGQRNPDVFIDLQRDDYRAWIRDNTLLV